MNTLRNRVSLIGNLGGAPEVQTTAANVSLAKFSVATNESYKDKTGNWVENTQWHNIVAWGKNAENVEGQLAKGSTVAMEGKLVHKMYEKDGQKRYATNIELISFVALDKKKEGSDSEKSATVKTK
jgi:single-strand DNA-binding protein